MVQPNSAMFTPREYDTIKISKRESEIIAFIQTGSNQFWEAYYLYSHRKRKLTNVLPIVSWFNAILKNLHSKKIFLEIPFIVKSNNNWIGSYNGYYWLNPGVKGSKANFIAFTSQEAVMEQNKERNKIL